MLAYLNRETPSDPVVALDSYADHCWVSAVAPTGEELDALTEALGGHARRRARPI
jgi:hypothetical protein